MVNVYDDNDRVIAQVEYNACLDVWDGNNNCSGGCGLHLGITSLKDGRYVLIHSSNYVGDEDRARIVDNETALQAILASGYEEKMLGYKQFEPLKELMKKTLIEEYCDDEES